MKTDQIALEKGSTLKGKTKCFQGEHNIYLELTPFQKGFGMQGTWTQNLTALYKMTPSVDEPSVSFPPDFIVYPILQRILKH